MINLTYRNKVKFFNQVKLEQVYYYSAYDFLFKDVQYYAEKFGVVIEYRGGTKFKVVSIPKDPSREVVMFNPEMLDIGA